MCREFESPPRYHNKKSPLLRAFFCYRIAGDLNSEREFENKRKADFRMPVSKADECRVDETKCSQSPPRYHNKKGPLLRAFFLLRVDETKCSQYPPRYHNKKMLNFVRISNIV